MNAPRLSYRRLAPVPATDPTAPNRRVMGMAVLILLALMVLAPYMTYKPQPYTGEGSPLRQFSYIIVVLMAVLGVRGTQFPHRLLVLPLSLGLVLFWCWLTLFWALDPDKSLRRLILTTLIIWTIFLLVENVSFERLAQIMRSIAVIVLIANFVLVLALPSEGIHQIDAEGDPDLIGSWRGFMLQKNFAGAFCAFSIMLFLFSGKSVGFGARLAFVVACAIFLYKTNSKTSMGLLIGSSTVGWLYLHYNVRYRALVVSAIGLGLLLLAIVVPLYWTELTAPFQSEDALTGRVQIWPALLAFANDNWLTGAGFGSFWNIGPDGPIYTYATKVWVTMLANGHNGYLDLLVQVGYPGLILAVLALFILPIGKLIWSPHIPHEQGALLLAFILFSAGHNVTETSLMERDAIVQIFLVFAVAMTHVAARGRGETLPTSPLRKRRRL